jgi:hypothetical protein
MQGDIATSILCPFGTFFPVLVSWSKKNLATQPKSSPDSLTKHCCRLFQVSWSGTVLHRFQIGFNFSERGFPTEFYFAF